jgi:hypothetical protein
VSGATFMIRINDFPTEPLYTLMIDEQEIEDLEDWPAAWEKPTIPDALLDRARNAKPPE